jgi:hypothetical protein
LRKVFGAFHYMAVRTDEGRGVFHLAVVSDYLPWKEIKARWLAITGADRIHISYERDFQALLEEMTRQNQTRRYSYSQGFVPDGSRKAIEALSRHFDGRLRYKALKHLARRWKQPDALARTITCIERGPGPGRYSDLASRQEYLNGRTAQIKIRRLPPGSQNLTSNINPPSGNFDISLWI